MFVLYDLAARDGRRFSPTCWRVKLALAHKGLAFETVPTAFTAISSIHGFSKTVPIVEHDGRWLNESSAIAHDLDDRFPDRPTLFGGAEGRALSAFVESWVEATLHAQLVSFVVKDIHDHLLDEDRDYFRQSREQRFGKSLEAVVADREARLGAFQQSLAPLRLLLARQPFLGGTVPLYADYVVLGAFQWARSVSPFKTLADDDPVRVYLERLMDLHGGLAREAVGYPL
ncbi:MAG: glutathione S-transferase N-terminal domain-containing protein [Pseudomonadota bacterium]